MTSLRPLSPHGEGYCVVCHFIEGLTPDGRIEDHERNKSTAYGVTTGGRCKGSGKKPPKLTPHTSRLAAFKLTADKVYCGVCQRSLVLLADGRIPGHTTAMHTTTPCSGGWQTPANQRDHGRERG